MMRYQRLSPELLPLPNGRKPKSHLRTCKEDDSRYRVRSGSGSANPAQAHPESDTSIHFLPSSDPFPPEAHQQQRHVLLQWGHRKRSRGSRAENRTAGEESTSHPTRQTFKIQRHAAVAGAEKIAAAAAAASMPPPPYTRATNLRPCVPSFTNHNHSRTVEDGSGGVSRSDKKRSPPPEKPHNNKKPAAMVRNGFGPDTASTNHHLDPKAALDHDKQKGARVEPVEWPRIYVSLSRKEKEEDFLAMMGTKLPQRPKKRAKNIDKTLQYCYPGMWLPDLTKSRYEVREKKCSKKKARGLKGMERSMDRDSD